MKARIALLAFAFAASAGAAPKKVATKHAGKKRLPASLAKPVVVVPEVPQVVDTDVFSEKTSFEALVNAKTDAERNPASLKPQARVIALRRELGLTRRDADTAPLDIVLNGGSNAGLSEGMVLGIMRKVPVLDPYRDNQQTEVEIEYGTVKIIHVQKEVSIARIEDMDSIQKGVALGTRGVFVGDYVGRSDD